MPTGLTKDAGWEIGVSKVVPFPVEQVWALLLTEPGHWLGTGAGLPSRVGEAWRADDGTHGELRSVHELDRVRLTFHPPHWSHDSTVQVAVRETPTGTRVVFRQERMASADEREAQRVHWQGVMTGIVAALEDASPA